MKLPSIGLTPELIDLAEAVSAFVRHTAPITETRQRFDDIAAGVVAPSWKSLVNHGFHNVHLPEESGGGGAGLVELAVITEQLGRTLFPGHFLPTVITSSVLAASPSHPLAERLLDRLIAGETAALVDDKGLRITADGDRQVLCGTSEPIIGLPGADIIVALVDTGSEQSLLPIAANAGAVSVTRETAADLTRSVGRLEVRDLPVAHDQLIACDRVAVDLIVLALLSAEAAGVAQWCLEATLDHVKQREQFGQIIGAFQAVQHKSAMMAVHTEIVRATAWDAARAATADSAQQRLAAHAAALSSLQLVRDIALDGVLLHGGMGYTWEHDIQLYWRKAVALAAAGSPRETHAAALGTAALAGGRDYNFVGEAEYPQLRKDIANLLDRVKDLTDQASEASLREARTLMADAGIIAPHYPPPYGIGAGPAEQVVVAQEFARRGLRQPDMVVGEWVLPTLLLHGTSDQQQRFVLDTLHGDIMWCQLFSEPGAGSDLAGLSTAARRLGDGWVLNGQKVWTSNAHRAHWGACLARTDPHAPKHRGISYFLVDMSSPGIEVRPLRQATGRSEFNEVFLSEVFVPDDCVVGEVNEGWKLATTTLANERLKMGTDFGHGSTQLLRQAIRYCDIHATPAEATRVLGECTAREMALSAMRLRSVLGRMSGLDTGATTSVQKVFNALAQRQGTTDILSMVGTAGYITNTTRDYVTDHLRLPAVMTGGGTVEIQLNVIAHRLLGLPR